MNGDVQGLIREASTLEDQENDSSSGKDRFLVSHFHFSSKDQTALLPLLDALPLLVQSIKCTDIFWYICCIVRTTLFEKVSPQ